MVSAGGKERGSQLGGEPGALFYDCIVVDRRGV